MVFGQILKFSWSSSSKNDKSWRSFSKRLDFKDNKFSVKNRDIHKIEKNNSVGISIFLKKSKIFNLCIKKYCEDKHLDLLLTGEGVIELLLIVQANY